jgi:hypothetical protein
MAKEERLMRAELEYVERFERGDAPSLEKLVETYPDMREELIEFVLDFVSDEAEAGAAEPPSEESRRAAAVARESVLEKVLADPATPGEPEGLVEARKATGERLGTLAAAVNVPRDVLSALEDGAIVGASVPAKLCNRLGRVFRLAPDLVRSFIVEARGQTAAVSLRAEGDAGQERRKMTFEEALRASPELNDEHLKDWFESDPEDEG